MLWWCHIADEDNRLFLVITFKEAECFFGDTVSWKNAKGSTASVIRLANKFRCKSDHVIVWVQTIMTSQHIQHQHKKGTMKARLMSTIQQGRWQMALRHSELVAFTGTHRSMHGWRSHMTVVVIISHHHLQMFSLSALTRVWETGYFLCN